MSASPSQNEKTGSSATTEGPVALLPGFGNEAAGVGLLGRRPDFRKAVGADLHAETSTPHATVSWSAAASGP